MVLSMKSSSAWTPLLNPTNYPILSQVSVMVTLGRLKKGQLVLLASVGAGFSVGAVLLRWGF